MSTISARTIRVALRWMPTRGMGDAEDDRALLELSRALSRAAPRRKAKSKAKRDETARIRAAVFERAGNGFMKPCEMLCGQVAQELHHAFGRGKGRPPQSVENCIALCWGCHRDWHASPVLYLTAFIKHCRSHGYRAEAERASARIQSLEAKGFTKGERT